MKNIDETVIVKFDGVDSSAVYSGGLSSLVNITNQLEWHKDEENESMYGMVVEYLTLKEISEQIGSGLITVMVDDPMRSKIYQFGNYFDDGWVFLGDVQGYA